MATIITKHSTSSGNIPSTIAQGELAINIPDGKLFYGSGSIPVAKEFTASLALTASYISGGVLATPAGFDMEIQFNNSGSLGATSSLKYNYYSSSLEHGYSQAPGMYSHSEGYLTKAEGNYSHAEGLKSTAKGTGSHAEGENTTALGMFSHAEGYTTQAEGDYSHAEGASTQAIGPFSHAEGSSTQAIGTYSHAEGVKSTAEGTGSHAEGEKTITSGRFSHAEGLGTIALGNYQHVQGTYNIQESHPGAFIIGNGIDDSNRSNLLFASGSEIHITGSLQATSFTGSLHGTASHALTSSYITSSNVAGLGTAAFLNNGTGSDQLMTVTQSDDRYRNPYLPSIFRWTGSQANSSNTVWQTVSESILFISSSGLYNITYAGVYDAAATTTGINLFVTCSAGSASYVTTVINADVQPGDRSSTNFSTFFIQSVPFPSSRTTTYNFYRAQTDVYFETSASVELLFRSEVNASAITMTLNRSFIRKVSE